ncbi:ribosome silencing factor [Peristeroidobacter agariperforans]|uniref:ribosome silencing factor n=1 Tax=Peristeroidobacter agariperforans TaxID=268404 RepID=UPI00101C6163|nr:ribosome silencing factor [Peristeroidobacter agariperforans]
MAVKRAKTSRPSTGAKKKASSKAPTNVTRLSTARKKLASKGPAPAAKKKAAASKAPAVTAPKQQPVVSVVEHALDEMKAVNVKVLAVNKLTDITDTMIIASGNSDRHVRSIADRVVEHAKKAGFRPMGVEGERDGEWVLVDMGDVIVHIMLPKVREFYRLESLWDVSAARREAAEQSA